MHNCRTCEHTNWVPLFEMRHRRTPNLHIIIFGYHGHRLHFNPFCKILNDNYRKLKLPNRTWKRSQYVYSPCMKWPRRIDRMQKLRWCLNSISVFLTLFTSSHIFHTISSHSWPEESFSHNS